MGRFSRFPAVNREVNVDTSDIGGGYPVDGSVSEVLDWVGDDPDRALEALERELQRDKPRKGVVEVLEGFDW